MIPIFLDNKYIHASKNESLLVRFIETYYFEGINKRKILYILHVFGDIHFFLHIS